MGCIHHHHHTDDLGLNILFLAECIDAYVALSTAHEESSASSSSLTPVDIDQRMSGIVERMFTRCIDAGEYRQALGIALESRRLDIVESIASQYSTNEDNLFSYLLEASMTVITRVSFRNDLLRLLVRLLSAQKPGPDYFGMAQCFVYLNDSALASKLLQDLLSKESETERILTAYQICFDLAETATQEFLEVIRSNLTGRQEPGMSIQPGTSKVRVTLSHLDPTIRSAHRTHAIFWYPSLIPTVLSSGLETF